jgi:hypothetical protein
LTALDRVAEIDGQLKAMQQSAQGTADQTAIGPDGKPVTIPGEQPRFFTPEEATQRDALTAERDSITASWPNSAYPMIWPHRKWQSAGEMRGFKTIDDLAERTTRCSRSWPRCGGKNPVEGALLSRKVGWQDGACSTGFDKASGRCCRLQERQSAQGACRRLRRRRRHTDALLAWCRRW